MPDLPRQREAGEMRELRIIIPGKPQPRQAHLMSTRGGRVRKYLPPESVAYQKLVAAYALKALRLAGIGDGIAGPVEVSVHWIFLASNRLHKLDREAIESGTRLPYTGRCDLDNLLKNLLDGLKRIAFEDDRFIQKLTCEKLQGKDPHTEVTIRSLEEK